MKTVSSFSKCWIFTFDRGRIELSIRFAVTEAQLRVTGLKRLDFLFQRALLRFQLPLQLLQVADSRFVVTYFAQFGFQPLDFVLEMLRRLGVRLVIGFRFFQFVFFDFQFLFQMLDRHFAVLHLRFSLGDFFLVLHELFRQRGGGGAVLTRQKAGADILESFLRVGQRFTVLLFVLSQFFKCLAKFALFSFFICLKIINSIDCY